MGLGCRFLHLAAGIAHEPLVEQILERHQVVDLRILCVYVIVDRDVADAELREPLLDIKAGVKLVAAQTAEVFCDDDTNFTVLHIGK